MKNPETSDLLRVIARSPFELYYDGEADAVSAVNRVGNFDILPGHADFFSMLEAGPVEIRHGDKDPIVIDTTNGIITVRQNEALLFLNM